MLPEEYSGLSCDIAEPERSPLSKDPVLAMAYIPYQQYGKIYTPEKALTAGTLFPELDKPFMGIGVSQK